MKEITAPRLKSLIVTLWGDALIPFGGRAWLGGLPRLLSPLSFDESLIRVSLRRLVTEGWLVSDAVGRKRDLSISDAHLDETRRVQAQIYAGAAPAWDGTWLMVQVAAKNAASRESIRRAFAQQGFASSSPNVFLHPHAQWDTISRAASIRPHLSEITAVFRAREVTRLTNMSALWETDAIRARWLEIDSLIDIAGQATGPPAAFCCQLLLVHAMRRLTLACPSLPAEIMPPDWPENPVRHRLKEVYLALCGSSKTWVGNHLVLSDGTRSEWVGFAPPRFGLRDV